MSLKINEVRSGQGRNVSKAGTFDGERFEFEGADGKWNFRCGQLSLSTEAADVTSRSEACGAIYEIVARIREAARAVPVRA